MNKPCPFCGHTETRTIEWWDEDGEFDAIECAKCKGAAPATIWNSRNNTALTKRLQQAIDEATSRAEMAETRGDQAPALLKTGGDMIRFHPEITVAQASQAAAAAGLILLPDWGGGVVIVTRERAAQLRGIQDQLESLREAACMSTVDMMGKDTPWDDAE
jgi:hypothetical protein